MPYLHWETQDRQVIMAQTIEEETRIRKQSLKRRTYVNESAREEFSRAVDEIKIKHAKQLTGLDSLAELDNNETATIEKKERKRSELAQYLLQIAKVYNAMDIEPDVQILRDYLYKDRPLHPRRTSTLRECYCETLTTFSTNYG